MIHIFSPMPHLPVNYTQIDFTETDEPRSIDFDDVYFSDCGGMDESEHVFIQGCDVRERLIMTADAVPDNNEGTQNRGDYLIGETGFGTGLNLLTLMHAYGRIKSEHIGKPLPHVTFLSVEKYPLSPEDILKAHGHFPKLAKESKELTDALFSAALHTGLNLREINGDFSLALMIGDINDCYRNLKTERPVDSWFLDGFNPKSNSDMWSADCMKLLAGLSAPGSNISTFTVCREVRNNLKEAGFTLVKRPGFGRKREMLTGYLPQ